MQGRNGSRWEGNLVARFTHEKIEKLLNFENTKHFSKDSEKVPKAKSHRKIIFGSNFNVKQFRKRLSIRG